MPSPRAAVLRRPRPAAVVVLALAAAACSRPRESALSDEAFARLSLRDRVAQLVVARVEVPARGDSVARARLLRLAEGGVGGVLLTGGGASDARALLDSLRAAAPLPLLAAVDADRGLGAVLAGGTELPPPAALGFAAGADAAAEMGRGAAAELRAAGIDLALVTGPPVEPDASLAPLDPRADAAAAGTAAYAAALRGAGLDVLVRAFPAPSASGAVPRFRWDRAALEAVGLAWLRGVVGEGDGVDAVALAPVSLPSLTGDTLPLPLSPVAVAGLLRRDLGFRGAVAIELGRAAPTVARRGEGETAVRALLAGTDLLVGVERPAETIDAVVAAVRAGRVPAARVEAAARRVFALKRRVEPARVEGEAEEPAPPPPPLPHPDAVAAAREAHPRALLRLGDPAAALRGCPSLAVVVTRREGASVVAAAVARARPGTATLVADTVALRGPVVRDTAAFRGVPACLLLEHRGALAPVVVDRLFADSAAGDTAAARLAAAAPARRVVEVGFLSNRVLAPRPAAAVLAWGLGGAAREAAVAALLDMGHVPEDAPRVAFPPARELREIPAESVGMSSAALARVDAAVAAALADGLAPGAAVVVGRRGGIVRMRGYGRVAPGGPAVDARETLYDVASLSKVVGTTAALMSLVEEGRVELDAPVRRYLPEFRGPGKGAVTVEHLLTHTSGLPAGAWLYSSVSAGPALDRVMRARLVYPTGTRAVYSDFGMILLAEVVARQAEEPLDTYLARRVFAPLGMASTMYRPPAWLHPWTAPAALRSERPYPVRGVVHDANAFRLEGVTGHAGLFSTAADVATLSQTLLNGGAYGPRRIWQPATVRRFTLHRARAGGRGLGWDHPAPRSSAGDYLAASSYGHTGFTGTSVWIDPVRDLFVVILTNRTYDNASQGAMLALRQAVADAAALALTDVGTVTPRAGTATAVEQERRRRVEEQRRQRERNRPRRPQRPRSRNRRG